MPDILLINGPNLNLLGQREPSTYGTLTLADIVDRSKAEADELGLLLQAVQSNCQGEIIDHIHRASGSFRGIIINPGAYANSHAIADAILASGLNTIEVHMSNVYARESWRSESAIIPVALGQIIGFGWHGYILAVRALAQYFSDRQ